jgi:formate-dependent nitrite reductase membrane component NrfD
VNFWVADPHWGGWIVAYFFLGGIAAGSYFLATLIEWFGSEDDRPLARIAYWIAFPLVVICGVLLVIDLHRPERFWHMLLKSEIAKAAFAEGFPLTWTGWRLAAPAPIFKYWSPMSVGSWGLSVFGACAFISFLTALLPRRRLIRWFERPWTRGVLQAIGCGAGFFVASYTGTLLSATNQPLWSDTSWLASLFLASAVSTSLATMTLLARWKNIGTAESRRRLSGAEPLALTLELFVLIAFLASLGGELGAVMMTWRGMLLLIGVVTLGVLLPLLLHGRVGNLRRWGVPAAALCVLLGGLLLRWTLVGVPGEILERGPAVLGRVSPEDGRRRGGGAGADPINYMGNIQPRTKMPEGP